MKRISLRVFFLLFIVFVVMANVSCDREPRLSMNLSDIKALGDSLPLKALHKMDSLREKIRGCSEYEQRRFDLLYLRLQDKADSIPVSDSIAKSLYLYLEKQGTPADRMEASYYLASVYRDLHDSPQAIYYFLKSMEVADEYEGMDSVLLANACSQLSYLYNRQYNYQASLRVSLKELDIVKKINRLDAKRIMDVATAYNHVNDTVNAVKYQNLVLNALRKERSEVKFADVVAELVGRYSDFGMMDKADTCMRMLADIPVHMRPHNYNIAMATYYEALSQMDSAIYYYKKGCESGDLMGQYNETRILAELYYERKDYENAAYYGKRFIEAERAYRKQLRHEQAVNVRNEYQYNRNREEEAAAYKAASEARSKWLWTLAASSVFIIAAILFLLLQRLRFANRERKRLEEIIAKDKELEEKTVYIAKKSSELHAVAKQLREKEDLLLQKNEQNSQLLRYALSGNIKVHAEEIMEKFNRASSGKYKLKDEDWRQFIFAMDELYPHFGDLLIQRMNGLTEDNIRICYLMKAGMTNSQIKALTDYGKTTVWRKAAFFRGVLGEELLHV